MPIQDLMNRAVQPPMPAEDTIALEDMFMEQAPDMGGGDPTDAANPLFPNGTEWESGYMPPPPPDPMSYQPDIDDAGGGGFQEDSVGAGDEETQREDLRRALVEQQLAAANRSDQYQQGVVDQNLQTNKFYNL